MKNQRERQREVIGRVQCVEEGGSVRLKRERLEGRYIRELGLCGWTDEIVQRGCSG